MSKRYIKNIGKPESKEDLMRFLGVIVFLSPFLPDQETKSLSLRGLLKKTSKFRWETDHQREFQQLKDAVSTDKYLQYYDKTAPVILEVDVYQKGLGAALM